MAELQVYDRDTGQHKGVGGTGKTGITKFTLAPNGTGTFTDARLKEGCYEVVINSHVLHSDQLVQAGTSFTLAGGFIPTTHTIEIWLYSDTLFADAAAATDEQSADYTGTTLLTWAAAKIKILVDAILALSTSLYKGKLTETVEPEAEQTISNTDPVTLSSDTSQVLTWAGNHNVEIGPPADWPGANNASSIFAVLDGGVAGVTVFSWATSWGFTAKTDLPVAISAGMSVDVLLNYANGAWTGMTLGDEY